MIIDTHYHQIPAVPDEMIEALMADITRALRIMNKKIDIDILIEKAKESWSDPDGEKLIAGMDEAGIDFTVVCAVDNFEGEVITTEMAQFQNKMVADVARNNPDRVMALAGIDPRRENAVDMLVECFDEFYYLFHCF